MGQTPATHSLTSQPRSLWLGITAKQPSRAEVTSQGRKQAASPGHRLTGTRKDAGVLLAGAQQSHQLGGLYVIQGEEADIILEGGRVTITHPWILTFPVIRVKS